jgi:hypothetical protein
MARKTAAPEAPALLVDALVDGKLKAVSPADILFNHEAFGHEGPDFCSQMYLALERIRQGLECPWTPVVMRNDYGQLILRGFLPEAP